MVEICQKAYIACLIYRWNLYVLFSFHFSPLGVDVSHLMLRLDKTNLYIQNEKKENARQQQNVHCQWTKHTVWHCTVLRTVNDDTFGKQIPTIFKLVFSPQIIYQSSTQTPSPDTVVRMRNTARRMIDHRYHCVSGCFSQWKNRVTKPTLTSIECVRVRWRAVISSVCECVCREQ